MSKSDLIDIKGLSPVEVIDFLYLYARYWNKNKGKQLVNISDLSLRSVNINSDPFGDPIYSYEMFNDILKKGKTKRVSNIWSDYRIQKSSIFHRLCMRPYRSIWIDRILGIRIKVKIDFLKHTIDVKGYNFLYGEEVAQQVISSRLR